MGSETKIEWTDHTVSPWWGCTKVSPGCDHCYAESWSKRVGREIWGPGVQRWKVGSAIANIAKLDRSAQKLGVVEKVFVASMSDVFDGEVPDEWRQELWAAIGASTNLVFQLLTKRPANVYRMLPRSIAESGKVWVGASMENQEWFWNRLPAMAALRMTYPNLVLFASYEPALGPIDFGAAVGGFLPLDVAKHLEDPGIVSIKPRILDWIIVGGESGHGARPFDTQWARSVIHAARQGGGKVFIKQLGSVWAKTMGTIHKKAGDPSEWPIDIRVREFPANRAHVAPTK